MEKPTFGIHKMCLLLHQVQYWNYHQMENYIS